MTAGEPTDVSLIDAYGSFSEPGLEAKFRAHELPSELSQIRAACLVVIVTASVFVINDLRATGISPQWLALNLIGRAVIVSYAVFYIGIAGRISSAQTLDRMTLILLGGLGSLEIWVDATRPKDFYTHVGLDVLVLMAIYLVIPLAQPLRFLAASVYTLGLFLLYCFYKQPSDHLSMLSATLAAVIANLLGYMSATHFGRGNRTEFVLLEHETSLRLELQRVSNEARTLKGLLPICAHCKKIRNDKGYWEQVEVYIQDRTDAQFSHGLCPECVKPYHAQLAAIEAVSAEDSLKRLDDLNR